MSSMSSATKRKGSTGGLEAPPSPNSANLLSFPRSPSPSGFQGFLTKSARWLSRTTSVPKPPPADLRQRQQLGATRRPTISSPSDPRPILEVPSMGLGASQ
ncbi:hypothetical protein M407DRAFT_182523 [Tulasnella calospora MUT 4182]|uniref:Uncharacterized protein n=1 Tax=Tulasnella calospora MUT 4182 TaxID=1051891 RepID=A0A0C3PQD4_9AGAM|nr:hypothetical protein M407DRAFT_182523 [Tulasnella calospora MUT 4182]